MFQKAVDKHNLLMKKGMENAGCDRHLFGLYVEAKENPEFKTLPEIFTDSAFTKRFVKNGYDIKSYNMMLMYLTPSFFVEID